MTKQMHERRILTVDGVSKELGEWAFEKGLTADTLLKRLPRLGREEGGEHACPYT